MLFEPLQPLLDGVAGGTAAGFGDGCTETMLDVRALTDRDEELARFRSTDSVFRNKGLGDIDGFACPADLLLLFLPRQHRRDQLTGTGVVSRTKKYKEWDLTFALSAGFGYHAQIGLGPLRVDVG